MVPVKKAALKGDYLNPKGGNNTVIGSGDSIDVKSDMLKGEFKLSPQEQAALLAGNLYMNLHTNVDGNDDDRAGFPTGENRININKNVVQFA